METSRSRIGCTYALLIVLAVSGISVGAQAGEPAMEIIAQAPNRAGGNLLITSVKCVPRPGNVILTTDADGGNGARGCAKALLPDRIYVSWDNGATSILRAANLTLSGRLVSAANIKQLSDEELLIHFAWFTAIENRLTAIENTVIVPATVTKAKRD